MSTTPNKPAGSTALGLLTALQNANGYVALAVQIAGVLVPIGRSLIKKIEDIGAGSVTITFTDLVTADSAELDAINKLATDDLAAINAELARMGLPSLPSAAAGPAADPAPGTSGG